MSETKIINVTLIAGNSDNKLTQLQWSDYVRALSRMVDQTSREIHFHGHSPGHEPWQNAAWVFDLQPVRLAVLRKRLRSIRERYEQDSVALIVGEVEFI